MNRIKNLRGRIDPDGRDVGGDRRKPAGRRPAPKTAASTPAAAPAARAAGGASHDETDFLAGIFDEDKSTTSVADLAGTSGDQRTEAKADAAGDDDSKPRRRGRRGGRGRGKRGKADAVEAGDAAETDAVVEAPAEAKPKAAPRRRGRARAVEVEAEVAAPVETPIELKQEEAEREAAVEIEASVETPESAAVDAAAPAGGRRRRTRGGRGRRRRNGDAADAVGENRVDSPESIESAAQSAAAIEAADEDFAESTSEAPTATDDDMDVDRARGRDDDRGRGHSRGESSDFDMDEAWDSEVEDRRVPVAEFDPDALDEEDDEEAAAEAPPPGKARRMLINVSDADECRIAILQEGRLDELYTERAAATSHVGNIYKGKVTNVESSIQAAFIDFGLPQHGFLHISDLHPQFFPQSKGEPELVGRKTPRRHRPPIQHCLRRGQEVIVQVIKEGIGTKGPTLTTYISLPGRFLVMMPGMDQLGVSRKIEDDDQRRKARDLLAQLSLPREMGFIVRTAGIDRTKRDLQRDLNYLVRLWKGVEARLEKIDAPAELYRESDLVIRTIRDVYDSTVEQIVVDNQTVAEKVREFLSIASPRARDIVVGYSDAEPLFYRYGIEAEIDKLHSKRVDLPCGGSLVIESTEALVAIDVNSGKFRIPDNAEETAYRVNCEAVEEIARQLRLRDLGGLIICDMIDMMAERHCRDIENRFRHFLKQHKERAKILKMSQFGIIEMTRQRQRPSLAKSVFRECPRCGGTGRMKSTESVALDVMRRIRMASQRENVASIDVRVATAVANDLLNRKRHALTDLERASGQAIRIHGEEGFMVDAVELACTDRRGREIAVADVAPSLPPRPSSSGSSYPGPSSGGRTQQGRGRWQGGRRDRDRGPRRNDGRGQFGGGDRGGNRGGGNRGGGGGHRSGGHGGGSNQGGAGPGNPSQSGGHPPDNIGNRADSPPGGGGGNGGGSPGGGGGGGNNRGRRRRRR